MIAAHGDCGSIGGGGEREGSQRSQGGDEHELRGKEDHVGELKMKRCEMRPVARMKR